MDVLEKARLKARKAIEKMYEGTCTVYEYQKVKNPATHAMNLKDVPVYENIPCKLSYSSAPATGDSQTADTVSQSIKLFLSPDIVIKAGSKITITQNGRTDDYKQSGKPAMYATHQEINLELYEDHP